ncbi:polysaccharide biosynthesis/export family protein [uncultured Cyclobacterium sp.]|uniref:polysaccharide biosynthesis/export family protein n=1 Tax=uncultured Cyclobacterium sp. TaxID=453820 RepID=UPI0030EF41DC|tara:strand:- start:126684 stop:127478 length:795 start_codon:yes stop_codon:yes gene_type:complete
MFIQKIIRKRINFYAFILLWIICSCSTYRKIPYFHDLDKINPTIEQIENYSPLTIQPEDILGINVSSLNPEASAIFNYNLNRVNGNNFDNSADNPVVGYLVDQQGNIEIPLIGSMKVAGLTTAEIRNNLKNLLLTYLSEPVVNIRILNFKISVFGDVLKPGVYDVQNERITIAEALSLAGDLQITAVRQIMLVREFEGKREYIPVDLTSKKMFESPYYYLKNNDVLYVQPDKTKFATVDRGYRNATILLSAMSVVAIIFSTLYR